ncbi:MAG: hypothetical protein IJ985_08190 [Akkermansia sp.]|nr:hypothetical protein [Akkermansia sp.]
MKKALKNLTRYTREKTSFLGWRVCISRRGRMFTKYFADGAYENGEEGSFTAAINLRDEILKRLESESSDKVLAEYQNKYEKEAKKARAAKRRKRAQATAKRAAKRAKK